VRWLLCLLFAAELLGQGPTGPFRNPSGTVSGTSIIPIVSWSEIPVGTLNGVNAAFTVQFAPNPASSLQLYRNGVLLEAGGIDYTLVGSNITFAAGAIPQTGDLLQATYQAGYSAAIPATCAANTVVAGPNSGAGNAPTCRAIVLADLPADNHQLIVFAFASLPSCNSGLAGTMYGITDANVTTFGATITAGSGSGNGIAYCNGTNWTFR
jgi:hypothetical protein